MTTSKRRTARGLETNLPIGLRLRPEERAELVQLSKDDDRSMNSFARMIYLLGLEEWKRARGML